MKSKGLISFILAAISSAFSILAILLWQQLAEQPTPPDSGGAGFSINGIPLLFSLIGLLTGLLGFISTLFSIHKAREILSAFHYLALILLLPAGYIVFRMLIR